MSTPSDSAPTSADDLLTVYEGRTRGFPPLRPYARAVFERRSFAVYLARADLKAKHYDTVLGQLWRVVNPLLLALVYFLVLGVILKTNRGDPDYLARLFAGLFAFYFTSNALNFGAKSIIGGGGLIMHTALPRALLPLSAVVSAFLTYLPMLLVYAVFHLLRGLPTGWSLLVIPALIAIHTLFNLGSALILSAATVYFRDVASFLPYMLRIWLYLSPILWAVEDVPERVRPLLGINPLAPIFMVWHDVLIRGQWPTLHLMAGALAWALAVLFVGLWFFLTREREFAVRL